MAPAEDRCAVNERSATSLPKAYEDMKPYVGFPLGRFWSYSMSSSWLLELIVDGGCGEILNRNILRCAPSSRKRGSLNRFGGVSR